MKCQMLCGRCKNTATRVLHSGGAEMTGIDMVRGAQARTWIAPKRDIYSCEQHLVNLKRSRDLYGGSLVKLHAAVDAHATR